jgi:hypothetical protein
MFVKVLILAGRNLYRPLGNLYLGKDYVCVLRVSG